jgi:hypothetical protein
MEKIKKRARENRRTGIQVGVSKVNLGERVRLFGYTDKLNQFGRICPSGGPFNYHDCCRYLVPWHVGYFT